MAADDGPAMTVSKFIGVFTMTDLRDVSVLPNMNIVVAQKTCISECSCDGRTLSLWQPPDYQTGKCDNVVSVDVVGSGEADGGKLVVALYHSRRLVLLSRSAAADGGQSWSLEREIALSWLPRCVAVRGGVVAVASAFTSSQPPPLRLLSLRDGLCLVACPMVNAVSCVALTDSMFVVSSWMQVTTKVSDGRNYIEAYSRTGAKQWTVPTDLSVRRMRPARGGDVLYLLGDHEVCVLMSEDGRLLANRLEIGTPLSAVSIAVPPAGQTAESEKTDTTSRPAAAVVLGSVRNAVASVGGRSKRALGDMTFVLELDVGAITRGSAV